MKEIRWVPGPVAPNTNITIPTSAPDIEAVVLAEIARIPATFVVAHGASVTDVAHADGATPPPHAGMVVDNHTVTQPDAHTLLPDTAVGAPVTNVLGEDAGGDMETARGAVLPGLATCIDAHANMAIDAHVVSAQPNDHTQAAIVAALAVHADADIAAALINHLTTGASIITAATPTRMTTRIIQLGVATVLGDLLSLRYVEVGERMLVS